MIFTWSNQYWSSAHVLLPQLDLLNEKGIGPSMAPDVQISRGMNYIDYPFVHPIVKQILASQGKDNTPI